MPTRLPEGRTLVFNYGSSDKFWEWWLYDVTGTNRQFMLRFRWGRRGTQGQVKDEYFTDKALALWKARMKEREKLAKGYTVVPTVVPIPSPPEPLTPAGLAAAAKRLSAKPAPTVESTLKRFEKAVESLRKTPDEPRATLTAQRRMKLRD